MTAAQEVRCSPRLERKRKISEVKSEGYHQSRKHAVTGKFDFNAKLQVAEKEIGESPAALREEIAHLIMDVKTRDDEIARLKEKAELARLEQRNMELEAARLKGLEDWRKQMRQILIGGEAIL
ncbi:c81b3e8e-ecf1-446e-b1d2-d3d84af00101 [Sclerotinia trifoliorum]|uniref:C81b3e8e-ecf1-446e-b1d2-d3d84af00101 n=1 Tax=Sclerotinia trifoliorum TaxID=28548 RepID=A0A8H2VZS4_9HELO|nr:c81b3e8e-ecf1-446e-b1d2-d3d84af00101 [Sclerotinia trifoliorum]